jgi:osmotically inducible protein OsmC
VKGTVRGMTAEAFAVAAEGAKTGCPVSKALAGVDEITLDAALD